MTPKVNLKFLMRLELTGNTVQWCMANNLIDRERKCDICDSAMRLICREGISDGCVWRCHKKDVKKAHDIKRSIRKGSWFANSSLSLNQILQLTYMWVYECPDDFICREVKVSSQTVDEWRNFCLEICTEVCLFGNQKLGGDGIIIELEDCKFEDIELRSGTKVMGNWMFSGIERESDRCFFSVVHQRSKEALINAIKENILPGSVIVSDCWKTFCCHSDEEFRYLESSHRLIFQDLEAKAYFTLASWTDIKRSVQGSRNLDGDNRYLFEGVWRRQHKSEINLFMAFALAAKSVYNDDENSPVQVF